MIVAEHQDRPQVSPPTPQRTLLVVTQNDHAHFAAELLSLWRRGGLPEHPRRQQILRAAREHDNGWREADAAPHADPETGRPLDFVTVPQELRREIWRRGVARIDAEREPWVALYIVQHALRLHRTRRSEEWSDLRGEWSELRDALLQAAGTELRSLECDYRWIELADLLSLAVCSAPWGVGGDTSSGWQRTLELHGYRAEVGPLTLRLDPFPLAGATTFRIPCRWIPGRPYRGDADLGTELAASRWGELEVRVVPARGYGSVAV